MGCVSPITARYSCNTARLCADNGYTDLLAGEFVWIMITEN